MPKAVKRASPNNKKPAAAAGAQSVRALPTHEHIAAKAYELFVRRGGQHGSDREDWLLAERELTSYKG